MRDTVKIRSYNGFYSGAYIQKTTKGVSLNMAYGVEPLTADCLLAEKLLIPVLHLIMKRKGHWLTM